MNTRPENHSEYEDVLKNGSSAQPICLNMLLGAASDRELNPRKDEQLIHQLNDTIEIEVNETIFTAACRVAKCNFTCDVSSGNGRVVEIPQTANGECNLISRELQTDIEI